MKINTKVNFFPKLLFFPIIITFIVLVSMSFNAISQKDSSNNFLSNSKMSISSGEFDIKLIIGDKWIRKHPLFFGLTSIDSPPQFAIWIEDKTGKYIETIYVTEKIAKASWRGDNEGETRVYALPHWCFKRGKKVDSYFLPTKDNPVPDAYSGATPSSNSQYNYKIETQDDLIIKFEVNHPFDYNKYYPEDAKKGDKNYSGISNGQPSIIYSAQMPKGNIPVKMTAVGCGSLLGTDGKIHNSLDKLTTAESIIKEIIIKNK